MAREDQRDNRKVYDKAAQAFRGKATELLTYKYIVRPALLGAVNRHFPNDRTNLKVLDVGSASGRNVHTLVQNGFQARNILGVEISPEQVKIARKEIPEAKFEVGDISTYTLEPRRNHLAIMIMVAEFLDEIKYPLALEKISTSLKPDGVFVYITTHPDRYNAKYGVEKGGAEVTTKGPWSDANFSNYVRSVREQKAALRQAGFRITQTEGLYMPIKVDEEDEIRLAQFTSIDKRARLVLVAHK